MRKIRLYDILFVLVLVISFVMLIIKESGIWLFIIFVDIGLYMTYRIWIKLSSSSLFHLGNQVVDYLQEKNEEEKQRQQMIDHQNELLEKLKQADASFSYQEFQQLMEKCGSLYLMSKSTHDESAIQELRQYASASFLDNYLHDIKNIKQAKEVAYKRVKMDESLIHDVEILKNKILIHAKVRLRFDYLEYASSQMIHQKECVHLYSFTFLKDIEDTGGIQKYEAITHCPNCGAPVDLLTQVKCAYCDSYLYHKKNIYVLHQVDEYIQE